ncbi:MAG TPA: hypothetical protein ENJ32_09270 [Crenotrichaceae bacterium]|nr:hypothetical protein [Crenotrichaceae bacterium]
MNEMRLLAIFILLLTIFVGCAEQTNEDVKPGLASSLPSPQAPNQSKKNAVEAIETVHQAPYKVTVMKKQDQTKQVIDQKKIEALKKKDEKNVADFHEALGKKVTALSMDLANTKNRQALKQTLKNSQAYRESMLRLAKEQMR